MRSDDQRGVQPGTSRQSSVRMSGKLLEQKKVKSPWAANTGSHTLLQTFSPGTPLSTQKIFRDLKVSLVMQNCGGDSRQQPLWMGQKIPTGSFPFFPTGKALILGERSNTVQSRREISMQLRGGQQYQPGSELCPGHLRKGRIAKKTTCLKPRDSVCLRPRLNQNNRERTPNHHHPTNTQTRNMQQQVTCKSRSFTENTKLRVEQSSGNGSSGKPSSTLNTGTCVLKKEFEVSGALEVTTATINQ